MRLRFALLLILLPLAFSGFSQTTSVCLTTRQAAKIADSLAVLPVVRQEAATWMQAASRYRTAADSFQRADFQHYQALLKQQIAYNLQAGLLDNEQAKTAQWKRRARRRGLVSYLLLALAGGIGYIAITH